MVSVAFGAIVGGRKPSHVSGVLPTSIDEKHRGGEGKENQDDQEKQAPRFDTGQGGSPQNPQEGEVEEDAVSSCDGGKPCARGALFKEDGDLLLVHQAFVDAATNANLCVLAISVNKELTRVGACTESAGRHGCSLFSPAARDSSTIRLNGKELGNDVLTVSGTNGFGMKLYSVDGEVWMAQSHDESR